MGFLKHSYFAFHTDGASTEASWNVRVRHILSAPRTRSITPVWQCHHTRLDRNLQNVPSWDGRQGQSPEHSTRPSYLLLGCHTDPSPSRRCPSICQVCCLMWVHWCPLHEQSFFTLLLQLWRGSITDTNLISWWWNGWCSPSGFMCWAVHTGWTGPVSIRRLPFSAHCWWIRC